MPSSSIIPDDLKPHDVIEVRWLDAFVLPNEPWVSADEVEDDDEDSQTVGYYLSHNDRFFLVAQSRGAVENAQYGGVFRIPTSCILGVDKLA